MTLAYHLHRLGMLEAVWDQMPFCGLVIDSGGIIRLANAPAEEALGRPLDGVFFSSLVYPPDVAKTNEAWADRDQTHTWSDPSFFNRYVRPDGGIVHIQWLQPDTSRLVVTEGIPAFAAFFVVIEEEHYPGTGWHHHV